MSSSASRARRLTFAAALVAAVLAPSAEAAGPLAWPNVDPRLGEPFQASVTLAATRLEDASCAAVYGDFADSRSGRPLSERLAETGQSAAGYLRWITFWSGVGLRPCDDRKVLAYTSPGSRVVFVCRDQFLRQQSRDATFAANILVHESLHSLGLAENPPSPNEVTKGVEARCGR